MNSVDKSFTLTSGVNKGNRRIWIEGERVTQCGLHHGVRLMRKMNIDGTMTLTPDPNGKHRVAGKVDRPIIDMNGKWVTEFMGFSAQFRVTPLGAGRIVISRSDQSDGKTNRIQGGESEKRSEGAGLDNIENRKQTSHSQLRAAVYIVLNRYGGEEVHLEDLYCEVEKIMDLKSGDLFPISDENRQPKWKRNLRNVLQSDKLDPNSRLLWVSSSKYKIAIPKCMKPTTDIEELEEKVEDISGIEDFEFPMHGNPTPAIQRVTVEKLERLAWIVKRVRDLADGKCELCLKPAPFNSKRAGQPPYLEVHHVVPLSSGGPDTICNAVALCPNCHARCHHSFDAQVATNSLYENVARLDRSQ